SAPGSTNAPAAGAGAKSSSAASTPSCPEPTPFSNSDSVEAAPSQDRSSGPTTAQLVIAFAAVYLIWGSTYLAIRIAIETIPPFTMAAVRFLTAGCLLYLWVRARGAAAPTREHWINASWIGALLILGGNGLVVWAE